MNYNYLIKRLLQKGKCLKNQVLRHLQFCEKGQLGGFKPVNEVTQPTEGRVLDNDVTLF